MSVEENLVSALESELANYTLKEYSVGRSSECTICITHPKISRKHARLIQASNHYFILEDLGSLNGTFVNGLRVTRKLVQLEDTIRFADTEFTVSQVLKQLTDSKPTPPQKNDPLNFTQEFKAIREIHTQYPHLKKAYKNRDKMIRTGSILLSSVIGIGSVLTSGGTVPILQLMSGAGLGMLIPTLSSTFLSTDEKLELLEKEYRATYRCPNPACQDSFIGREYERLAEQKKCKKCKAIWVE